MAIGLGTQVNQPLCRCLVKTPFISLRLTIGLLDIYTTIIATVYSGAHSKGFILKSNGQLPSKHPYQIYRAQVYVVHTIYDFYSVVVGLMIVLLTRKPDSVVMSTLSDVAKSKDVKIIVFKERMIVVQIVFLISRTAV